MRDRLLEVTGNPNYAAQVIRVGNLLTLPGLDNLRGVYWAGYQALVSKDVSEGDLLVMFPAETQLSESFAKTANLFRHPERNQDPDQIGYLEDSARIRAIKLRGHRSDALALTVDHFGVPLQEGDTFDTLNGDTVCWKYDPPQAENASVAPRDKLWKRVDDKFLPEHPDTGNFWREHETMFSGDDLVVVSQKLHGSSVRIANTIVAREPNWKDRWAKKFGVRVADTEYASVFGSRRVIKDPHNLNQAHYYTEDLWSRVGADVAPLIPQGVVMYGEIIGWTQKGTPIQSGYTYDIPKGGYKLYVYRVSVVTPDRNQFDLSWEGMEEFCQSRGLRVVPVLWKGLRKNFVPEEWVDRKFFPQFPQAVPLSDPKSVDEGVVISKGGRITQALKAKSPIFLGHETKILDSGTEVLS